MYQVTPISAFSDNYIWMLSDAEHAVVVDPGDAEPVIKALQDTGKKLAAILITHHHSDHTGGVDQLVKEYGVTVYGPENSKYKGITKPLNDGESIELFNTQFVVKAVPGHTLDHICYFNQQAQSSQIFCGDTLFLAGCGRVFEGSMQQMLTAMNYFKTLPLQTKVYCTHEYSLSNLAFAQAVEPNNLQIQETIYRCKELREKNIPTLPSTMDVELLINPFLRCEEPSVKEGVVGQSEKELNSDLAVFSALRNWKNNF
jgi:hydroxyacylglutathione hydrolase